MSEQKCYLCERPGKGVLQRWDQVFYKMNVYFEKEIYIDLCTKHEQKNKGMVVRGANWDEAVRRLKI
jgi:hypothetical protein